MPVTAGHHGGLQIFLVSQLHEAGRILLLHHHGHSLLGFTDGQFRAVQALIFFRYLVQVNLQALGQLANGHGDTAGPKVVAAFDQTGGLRISEQTLQLRSSGALPFWTSAPQVSRDSVV